MVLSCLGSKVIAIAHAQRGAKMGGSQMDCLGMVLALSLGSSLHACVSDDFWTYQCSLAIQLLGFKGHCDSSERDCSQPPPLYLHGREVWMVDASTYLWDCHG